MREAVSIPPEPISESLFTVGGLRFTLFSKDAGGSDDVYTNMVATYYGTDIYCETWLFGTTLVSCAASRELFM